MYTLNRTSFLTLRSVQGPKIHGQTEVGYLYEKRKQIGRKPASILNESTPTVPPPALLGNSGNLSSEKLFYAIPNERKGQKNGAREQDRNDRSTNTSTQTHTHTRTHTYIHWPRRRLARGPADGLIRPNASRD